MAKGLDILVQSRLAECSCRAIRHGKVEQIPILPELYHLVNLPQEKAFHTFDGWYHTLAVVAHTEPDLTLRWGALLHDVAKGMPRMGDSWVTRYKYKRVKRKSKNSNKKLRI